MTTEREQAPQAFFDEFKDPLISQWKRIRSCIEREDDLIDQRLRWLLTSQGFLFAAFAATLAASLNPLASDVVRDFAQLVVGALALIAILICVFVWTKIRTAEAHLRRLKKYWFDLCGSKTTRNQHPPIMGWTYGFLDSWLSFRTMPVLFGFGWLLFFSMFYLDEIQRLAGPIGRALLFVAVLCALVFVSFAVGRRSKTLEEAYEKEG